MTLDLKQIDMVCQAAKAVGLRADTIWDDTPHGTHPTLGKCECDQCAGVSSNNFRIRFYHRTPGTIVGGNDYIFEFDSVKGAHIFLAGWAKAMAKFNEPAPF